MMNATTRTVRLTRSNLPASDPFMVAGWEVTARVHEARLCALAHLFDALDAPVEAVHVRYYPAAVCASFSCARGLLGYLQVSYSTTPGRAQVEAYHPSRPDYVEFNLQDPETLQATLAAELGGAA